MAVSFGEQIHALTGFDGDSADASEIGENYDDVTAEWMNGAIREVINLLPASMLQRCAKMTTDANYTDGDGMTHEEKVISVVRAKDANFNAGEVYTCRQIPFILSHKAADANSLEYAKETDPVYYYEPQADNTAVLVKVLPTSSAIVTKVYSVDYPVFDADGSGANTNIKTATSIANFPDEAENLVVLRAALTAAEYKLNFEEDVELYTPLISNLRNEYQQAVLALQTRKLYTPKKEADEG
jgi:hypothetical protein